MGKYVIILSNSGEAYFNLKSSNGRTILTSEMYASKASCREGIDSVRENCYSDHRYERKQSSNNKHYFNLKASNGRVIGISDFYESEGGMENGILSVKKNGLSSTIVEE